MADIKDYVDDMNDIKSLMDEEVNIDDLTKKIREHGKTAARATATAPAPARGKTATEGQAAPAEQGGSKYQPYDYSDNSIDVEIDNIEFEVETEDDEPEFVEPEPIPAYSYENEWEGNDYRFGNRRKVARSINKHLYTWVFSFILGMYGGDRFVRGQIGLGVLKLLTFGGLGLWYMWDLIIAIVKSYGISRDSEDLLFDIYGNFIN